MILAAGLSPAWQHTLVFDRFRAGAVNRAREVHWSSSGKVLNVAIAARHLGASCRVVSVAGGAWGREMAREMTARGIGARWVASRRDARVCTTIIDLERAEATELVENAPEVTEDELDAFRRAYAEEAEVAQVVVLTGSLPPGIPTSLFADLVESAQGPVVLDTRGEELLQALPKRPFLVKPNRDELGATLRRPLSSERQLVDAMAELVERGAEWVVATQESGWVWVLSRDGCWRMSPPRVPVVSAIGCGDSMAAAIAVALGEGKEPVEAVRYGVAAAADNLSGVLIGRLDRARVEAHFRAIVVERTG